MTSKKIYSIIGGMSSLYDFFLDIIGYRKSVDYFVSQLPFSRESTFKVLDAGCGTGLYTLALLERYPNVHVTVFDLNPNLVERLRVKVAQRGLGRRVKMFVGDIQGELAEIEGEKFDLILTAGVLEYVPQEEAIKSLSRFLSSSGYFFNSPVRDTLWGKVICKLYACVPNTEKYNLESFKHNGFAIEKSIRLPWYQPTSFKEAHIFKKLWN